MNSAHRGLVLSSKWRSLKGVAYGLKQATLIGGVRVKIAADYPFAAVDEIMGQLFEATLPMPNPTIGAARALLHRLLFWHAAVQRQQNIPVFDEPFSAIARTTDSESSGVFFVALPCHSQHASLTALSWVSETLNALMGRTKLPDGPPSDISEGFVKLLQSLNKYALNGINNFHFLHAAHGLDIPVKAVMNDTFCFGNGANRRWLQSSVTDRTPAIAMQIAHSKSRTAHILRMNGITVPRHTVATSEEHAAQMAKAIGYPVVIKPDDQEQGRGVEAGLHDEAAILAAYRAATQFSKTILVEKHHEGQDYRVTVFQDRVIKIMHRSPGGVVGDGARSVAELVAREQQTPRHQKAFRQQGKWLLEIDREALGLLAERQLTGQSIPAPGEFICLRRKANLSAGGTQKLILVQDAHPDNIDLAIRATRAIQLDLCGVDLLIPDISKSWLETGAVIVEMNGKPQIGISLAPEVYPTILRELVPGNGHIPVYIMVYASNSGLPSQDEALELMTSRHCNGLSMAQGVWVDRKRVTTGAVNGFEAARVLLFNDRVTAAVCAMTAEDVVRDGLPVARAEQMTFLETAQATERDMVMLKKAMEMSRGHARELSLYEHPGPRKASSI